jgi:hypothetical protein
VVRCTWLGAKKETPESGPVRDRILAQGQFLVDMKSPALPRGVVLHADGYSMEFLEHLPWEIIDGERLVIEVARLCRQHIWSRVPGKRMSESWREDHLSYMADRTLVHAPDAWSRLVRLFERVDFSACQVGVVHGDPTFDNVMMRRRTSELVVIDPLPGGGVIPNLVAVDRGKILQSVIGYERVKYGVNIAVPGVLSSLGIMGVDTVDETLAALYFAAAHVVRLLPYQSEELRPLFLPLLDQVLNCASSV